MLAEETEAAVHAAGWFLEHAWLIPLIPAVAFFLIRSWKGEAIVMIMAQVWRHRLW